jgi:mono/diheme cytochrome c family protein
MRAVGKMIGIAVLVVLTGVALSTGRRAEFDFGKREYEARCAGCHGPSGKGDGVNRAWLDRSPTDLTVLAKNNGGEFPYWHVYVVVEGRLERGRDMPCFKDVYEAAAAEDHLDVPYETDRYRDTRLAAVADYLVRLQVR